MKGGGGMIDRVLLVTVIVAAWVAGLMDGMHGQWTFLVSLLAGGWVGMGAAELLLRSL